MDELSALRNFAAHGSKQSKKRALQVIGGQRIASSGAWLKKKGRFGTIVLKLKELADEIKERAPY